MALIERKEYTDWLKRYRDKKIIKVITGLRRVGKSTIFELYIAQLLKKSVAPEDISANLFTSADCDLIIRPSGEQRLSNFLLWQSAYSEFWYSDVLWPDFTEKDLHAALSDFEKRNRRFGG